MCSAFWLWACPSRCLINSCSLSQYYTYLAAVKALGVTKAGVKGPQHLHFQIHSQCGLCNAIDISSYTLLGSGPSLVFFSLRVPQSSAPGACCKRRSSPGKVPRQNEFSPGGWTDFRFSILFMFAWFYLAFSHMA